MDGAREPQVASDWTAEELALLSRLARDRISAADAARVLGRRVSSVRRQARQSGVLLYKHEGRIGRRQLP